MKEHRQEGRHDSDSGSALQGQVPIDKERDPAQFLPVMRAVAGESKKALSWEGIQLNRKNAQQQWENMQLRLATQLSLEEDAQKAKKKQESLEQVAARLTGMGLQRVDTPAEGDCQFLAVLHSARACGCSSALPFFCVYLVYAIA